MKKNPNDAKT